ncbi:MAG: hypothetical protein Q8P22_14335 [Chloroflexota bacterium]|nr:hypothetical protein [Chloroflexota bacterium]
MTTLRDAAWICAPLGYQQCALCGRIARDVALRPVVKYQGGAGTVQVLQCDDVAACWIRAEEQDAASVSARVS